jgi:hypothetical protein
VFLSLATPGVNPPEVPRDVVVVELDVGEVLVVILLCSVTATDSWLLKAVSDVKRLYRM